MLQIIECIPYKGFKARVRIVQGIERVDRGAKITVYDECVVVSKLEEEPGE